MATYQYSAKNLDGQVISGVCEAENYNELKKIMYSKGYFITKANVVGKEISFKGIGSKVKMKDFVVLCRQFSVILNSGLTVVEAISILIQQTQNKKLKEALLEIHEQLLKGSVLSGALKNHKAIFPEFFVNMIKVGEASGTLDVVLNRLADYYERENKIRKKVKSALTYPVIVMIVAIGVITLLMVKVLPMFASMLQSMGGELPLITKVLMAISSFMVNSMFFLILFHIIFIFGVIYYVRTEMGRYRVDGLKLKVPIIKGTVIKVITAKFARSMGLLLKSGISVVSAMDIMQDLIGNKVVEEKFKLCSDDIKGGRGIATSLKKMLIFPPLLVHMVSVGENTGELDDMLIRTAAFFDDEVEEAIDSLTTMIEPVMIITLAVIVGGIILAVMLPMVNIMQNIS